MSIIQRLFDKREEKRAVVQESHPRDPVLAEWWGSRANTSSGVAVTPDRSLGLIPIYSAVSLLADSISSLPLVMYQTTSDGGKQKAPQHPLHRVLNYQPNRWQTSQEFRQMMMGHKLLRGAAYAEIIKGTNVPVSELVPLHPDRVTPFKAPDGSRAFEYAPIDGPRRIILQDEMLFIPDMTIDGYTPISRIELAKESVALGMAAEEFGGRFFGNGTVIGGVLTMPGKLTDQAYDRLKNDWNSRHQGLGNSYSPAILEGDMKWQSLGVKPEEAQFLETRKFQVSEYARLFRVPPHLIGDIEKSTSWGSGIYEQNKNFIEYSLLVHIRAWEQSIYRDLLTTEGKRRFYAKHIIEGLLRGSPQERAEFYTKMFALGVSINEIREKEDLNPVDGGDQRFVPMNMVTLEQAGKQQPAQNQPQDGQNQLVKLIESGAERVARKEIEAIGKALKRGADGFSEWSENFYNKHAEFISSVLAVDIDCARQYTSTARAELVGFVVSGNYNALYEWQDKRIENLKQVAGL